MATYGVAAFCVVVLIYPCALEAQIVGRIQGRVTTDTGQPIQGAQIAVPGSRLGNITDPSGYYFINGVPAGSHDVQVQMIGFQRVVVKQNRVLAGQTLTLDFSLRPTAIELDELVVFGESRPLVPRDQVASKNIVMGDLVDELPVDNVNQMVLLQPGVVAADRAGSKGLSVRGGRSGEEAVYVDGVLVRNFNEGRSRLSIGTNTLAELDVLTGGYSAEFGEAQSGIINYVTRSGTRRWSGALTFESDETAPKAWSIGYNRAELSFGGPLVGNVGFFFGGTASGQRFSDASRYWRTVPIYVAHGIDTTISMISGDVVRDVAVPNFVRFDEGGRQPFGGRDEYTLDLKLDYSYGSGSRIFITTKTSRNQERGTPRVQIYNLHNTAGTVAKSSTIMMSWTQNFVRTSERALSVDVKIARQHDWLLRNNLAPDRDLRDDRPALGFSFKDLPLLFERDDLAVDKALVTHFMRNEAEAILPFMGRTDLLRSQEFRMNPYGVASGFPTRGLDGGDGNGIQYADEKNLQLRAALDWQPNRKHRLKFGGDYFNIDVERFAVLYNSLAFAQLWIESPKRASLFIQERMDAGDIVVEAGLRYDRFDPNSTYSTVPGYFVPDDPTTFRKAPVRHALSPRLGVSFPVTVNSTFRFNYGHYTQVPDLDEYYRGKNINFFVYQNTNTNDVLGRPLRLAKTIAFEVGFRQLIAADFVIDVAAYHRDKVRDVSVRKLRWDDPRRPGAAAYLNTFTNADFGAIRGVDLRLDRRWRWFSGMLGYSYQNAQNTGTDPFTAVLAADRLSGSANSLLGLPPSPPQAIRPTEENRHHNFTSHISLVWPSSHPSVLSGFGWHTTARAMSGFAYTRLTPDGELKDGEISSGRMPWQRHIDMRVVKSMGLRGYVLNLVADIRNVFDLENRLRVFQTTDGLAVDWADDEQVTGHRATLGGGIVRDRIDLRSRSVAGPAVNNDVNLYLLQCAERRFGNGDGIFDGTEQDRAFRAAELYLRGPQDLIGPGRRVRFGLELAF